MLRYYADHAHNRSNLLMAVLNFSLKKICENKHLVQRKWSENEHKLYHVLRPWQKQTPSEEVSRAACLTLQQHAPEQQRPTLIIIIIIIIIVIILSTFT